eukprot:12405713-Karenia_brevis.AAC.1
MPCFVAHDNDNKKPTQTQWKKIAGQSKGHIYYVAECAAHNRKHGGKGQQGALRQFSMHNSEAINTDLAPDEDGPSANGLRLSNRAKLVLAWSRPIKFLLVYMGSAHVSSLVPSSYHWLGHR